MKIAFASCFCEQVFPNQPVWDWIVAKNPDYLILLGDSIYLDIHTVSHPMLMTEDEFAQHLFKLYSAQLQVPEFARLIKTLGPKRVFSIWDDHDFLWNDELGAEALASPEKRDKVILSSAFQTAFRKTIYSGLAPNTFPKKYNAPEFWQTKHYPLDTPSYLLPENVWLHLSDGRTHRTRKWAIASSKRTLLGRQQKEDLAKVYASSDIDSVHLFASGSVLGDYKKTYPIDFDWLLRQSSLRRTLALSGDIHRNSLDEFAGKRFPLYEATSSGAAVRELVVVGERRDNFGILEIDQNSVSINLYAKNKVETKLRRKINRSTWGVV
ncbi:MAG: hypothetical protein KBA82_01510 [Nitrosomonas sp.]|nr:hypothetical protein [Nitrosomonas sp.]